MSIWGMPYLYTLIPLDFGKLNIDFEIILLNVKNILDVTFTKWYRIDVTTNHHQPKYQEVTDYVRSEVRLYQGIND